MNLNNFTVIFLKKLIFSRFCLPACCAGGDGFSSHKKVYRYGIAITISFSLLGRNIKFNKVTYCNRINTGILYNNFQCCNMLLVSFSCTFVAQWPPWIVASNLNNAIAHCQIIF
jgi:hypothetical protein